MVKQILFLISFLFVLNSISAQVCGLHKDSMHIEGNIAFFDNINLIPMSDMRDQFKTNSEDYYFFANDDCLTCGDMILDKVELTMIEVIDLLTIRVNGDVEGIYYTFYDRRFNPKTGFKKFHKLDFKSH